MKAATQTVQPHRLKSVIFDMDGVIVDSHPAHRRAWQKFLQTLGKTVSESDLKYILDGRKRTEILAHFLGDLSEDEIQEYGRRKDAFFQQISLEIKPVPGVLELLDDLREHNIAVALATSAGQSRTSTTLHRLRIRGHFNVIVTGNDVTQGKPDPAIYRLACRKLQVPPEHAIAIEDAVSGVRAAKAAGLHCIAVGGHESQNTLRTAGADYYVRDFVGVCFADLESLLSHSYIDQPRVAAGRIPLRT
jgi:beta-phosphoglucomutase